MAHIGSYQLQNEPIVISTYKGTVNVEAISDGSSKLIPFLDAAQEPLYVIVDVTEITSSLTDALQIMAHQSRGEAGTTTDPRLAGLILVGTDSMAKLYSHAMEKRHSGMHIPMYAQLSDALSAVRTMIEMGWQTRKAS